jgi:hypothetical protein
LIHPLNLHVVSVAQLVLSGGVKFSTLRASATLWPGLGKIEVIILLRNFELLAQLNELRLFLYSLR